MSKRWFTGLIALAVLVVLAIPAVAQETTGGLQGIVKDPSGAVVPNAQVVVTGATLVGKKEIEVTIHVERTFRPPNDARDLGLSFGVVEIR